MAHEICAYDDCENEVTEDDYCEECGCYICEEHNLNLINLSSGHTLEEHWEETE
jgi:hypothetical protein